METHNLADSNSKSTVDFLWLELTNQCNLQCTHCYAESGPRAQKGTLSVAKYAELMKEAFALGCRRIQFIGGEPMLNRDLPVLVESASGIGYDFIEVFSNLTRLSEELLQCFVEYGVRVATSVYGPVAECHDLITQVSGSFERTTISLRRLIKAGVPVRAGVIGMALNAGQVDSTVAFLREVGIRDVGVDRLRRFGRGAAGGTADDLTELCGNCAGGTLCVSPTGRVSPCIMSKNWTVGSTAETSLSDLVNSQPLREIRNRIYDAVVSRAYRENPLANCNPQACSPDRTCFPQSCDPNRICFPSRCDPNRISQ